MSKQNVGAAGLAEVGGRTVAVEKRFRQSIYLAPELHEKAVAEAAARGVSLSTLAAAALVDVLKAGAAPGPMKAERPAGAIKATVALSASLRARARRALAGGGTLQGLIVQGLERLLWGA